MAHGYRTLCAIPRLSSYEDAVRREADTKPVRGDEQGRKPLGLRNQKWRHIRRDADNSIAIYAGYPTAIMRFMPDGDLHIYDMGYHAKATFNEIITEVTGMVVRTELGKAWVNYDGGTAPLREAPKNRWVGGQWVEDTKPKEPSIFRKNERGRWVYINPPLLTTHVVSRKGAKQVRERYVGPLTYIEALTKLRKDDTPTWVETARAFPDRLTEEDQKHSWVGMRKLPPVTDGWGALGFTAEHARTITGLMLSEEAGDHYKAYLWLHRDTTPEHVMANADKVLMLVHHDEWFTQREVPAGQKAHDRYKWVFEKQVTE